MPAFAELAGVLRAAGPASDTAAPDSADPGGRHGGHCRVIGVDGLSGAGKTGFAHRLASELAAPVLSTDDLVPGWDGLAESIVLLTDWVLRPLADGKPARWRRYDWLAGEPGEWASVKPGAFLIVEGCCVGTPPAAAYLSSLIWIDAPAADRRARLELRADWPWYAPHAAAWARQEEAIQSAARTSERADLVIDNSAAAATGEWADGFTGRRRDGRFLFPA